MFTDFFICPNTPKDAPFLKKNGEHLVISRGQ